MPRNLEPLVRRLELSLNSLLTSADSLARRLGEIDTSLGNPNTRASADPSLGGSYSATGALRVEVDQSSAGFGGRTGARALGGLISGAAYPATPYLALGGVLVAGLGDEVADLGIRFAGSVTRGMIENSNEISAALAAGLVRELSGTLRHIGSRGTASSRLINRAGNLPGAFVGRDIFNGLGLGGYRSVLDPVPEAQAPELNIFDSFRYGGFRNGLDRLINGVSDFIVPPAGAGSLDEFGGAGDLIRNFEGLQLDPYSDVGYPAIGYGQRLGPRGTPLSEFGSITEEQANSLLGNRLGELNDVIDSSVTAPINRNQRDALLSFAYNVGEGNFRNSTLLNRLNSEDYEGAASEFTRWTYAGGEQLAGLVRRREAERELFEREVSNTSAPLSLLGGTGDELGSLFNSFREFLGGGYRSAVEGVPAGTPSLPSTEGIGETLNRALALGPQAGVNRAADVISRFSPGTLAGLYTDIGQSGGTLRGVGEAFPQLRGATDLAYGQLADYQGGLREGIESLPFRRRFREEAEIAESSIEGLSSASDQFGRSLAAAIGATIRQTDDWTDRLRSIPNLLQDILFELAFIQPATNLLSDIFSSTLGGVAGGIFNSDGGTNLNRGRNVVINQTINDADQGQAFQYTDSQIAASEDNRLRGRARVTSPDYSGN